MFGCLDQQLLHTVSNHPVHILNKDQGLSPSAFIPFCAFGDDLEAMGTKAEGFDTPVCNSFKARILNNQLCYEVDLEKFKSKENIISQLENGLSLILDYSEDKQIIPEDTIEEKSFKEKSVQIHLNTISKF